MEIWHDGFSLVFLINAYYNWLYHNLLRTRKLSFGPYWDLFFSFPHFILKLTSLQTDMKTTLSDNETNFVLLWAAFSILFLLSCSSWLTQTRLLLWQRSLTSRLKYANHYHSFHLHLCQIHCNYKEMVDSSLYKKNVVTYSCHLL